LKARGKPGRAIRNENACIRIAESAAVDTRDCAVQSGASSRHSQIDIGGAGIRDRTGAGQSSAEYYTNCQTQGPFPTRKTHVGTLSQGKVEK
jgi:hypothetical protein